MYKIINHTGTNVNNSHHTLTYIYAIIHSIDDDSLKKIISGRKDELHNKVKAKLSEMERVGKEFGWYQSALFKAIDIEIKKKAKT